MAAFIFFFTLSIILSSCSMQVPGSTRSLPTVEISSFCLEGFSCGDIVDSYISVEVPNGTDRNELIAVIKYNGSSITPASGTAQNFIEPVVYTVTSDISGVPVSQSYTVVVTEAAVVTPTLSSSKDIIVFAVEDRMVNVGTDSIFYIAPFGTNIHSIDPTIITSPKATVTPESGDIQDFEDPVTYTVKAEDGSEKVYTVEITEALSDEKEITEFSILGRAGRINGTSITVAVPYGTPSFASLTPDISYIGSSIDYETGVSRDFTHPVHYIVYAADGTAKDYTVNVVMALNDAKDIMGFTIPDQYSAAVIDTVSKTVNLVMQYGTNLASLTPTITVSDGATIDPPSLSLRSFENPVHYTVRAEDSSVKIYTVTVTALATMPTGYMQTFQVEDLSFKMAYLPGGLSFKASPYTNNQYTVVDTLPTTITDSYWVAETHVTYELWETVRTWAEPTVDDTNCYPSGKGCYSFANHGLKGSSGTGNVTQPVTSMNWRDAIIWLNALTEWYNAMKGTGYTCVYYTDAGYTTPLRTSTNSATITASTLGSEDDPYINTNANGFRLLTSMEWELAGRYKGNDSSNGAYEWGGLWWTSGNFASGATNMFLDAAATQAVSWYSDNSGGTTHDVKLKNPNGLGLYDMNGNIWIWASDWYTFGSLRVARGGCFSSGNGLMQIGARAHQYLSPNDPNVIIGMRFGRSNL